MRARWALLLLLGAACKTSGTRTTDTRSSALKSKALKLAFLKDYLGSPTEPQDVEFHVVFQDHSGALFPTADEYELQAGVKVPPDQVPRWAMGCTAARLEVRPAWVGPLLEGKTGFEVKSQPDTFRCGREERVIHVHEGVILRQLKSE